MPLSGETNQLVIIGLPKSGNVFYSATMQRTLGCTPVVFCTRAGIVQQVMPEKLIEFASLPRAVGGGHMPPTEFNLRLLEAVGVRKVGLLFRDPRDALISWWRHLARPDIRDADWVRASQWASGMQSSNYFELGEDDALGDLARLAYPRFQHWMRSWLEVMDARRTPFEFHISHFEAFCKSPREALSKMLRFFGHEVEPDMPSIGDRVVGGIDINTHFRRGVAGSYRDEAPAEIVQMLDDGLDRALAARLGWKAP